MNFIALKMLIGARAKYVGQQMAVFIEAGPHERAAGGPR